MIEEWERPGSPERAAVAAMTPAERADFLRAQRFPKLDVLTAGLPEGVASVLARALGGDAELIVLRGAAMESLALGGRLAQIFEHHPHGIGELRMRDSRLGDEEAQKMLTVLGSWDSERPFKLKALDLSSCDLFRDQSTAVLLQQAIKASLSLRELTLSLNPLGDPGAHLLASVLKPSGALFCPLVSLDLRRCGIGPAGGAALCDALSSNESLRSLNLTGNLFCNDVMGAPAVGRLLAGASAAAGLGLTSLVCGDCALKTTSSVEVVLGGLRNGTNRSLQHLIVPSNSFGETTANLFAAALEAQPQLLTLQLSGCSLSDATARLLGAVLANHKGLQTLHLGQNDIRDAGAGALGRAIESNNALWELALNDNAIGPSGMNAIFTALRFNKSLAVLNLAGNTFGQGSRAAISLSLCLRYNGALRHLDLSRCHMRDDFIVTPDGTPASLAQPMGSSVLEDDSDVKVNNDKNDDDEDNTTVVGGSGFVGFGPVSTNHDEVPGPVSVCDAITENFTLDVLRVDQNRLSAAAQDALDLAMSREKRPAGHVLDAMQIAKEEQREKSAREAAAAAAAAATNENSNSSNSATAVVDENAPDPMISAMRPGQWLDCPVAIGRPDNHVAMISVTIETTLAETRSLIDGALVKPVSSGYGFVSKGLGKRVIPKDEEDKRCVLWECGRTILCRPDDWIVL